MGGDVPIPGQPHSASRAAPAAAPAPSAAAAPRRKVNWWVVAAFVAVGAAAVYIIETYKVFTPRGLTASTNHPAVGKTPARIELEALNADEPPVTLESLRGNVVVLNFWGTWCPPCRGEIGNMAELSREWSRDHVRVVPVSCLQQADDEAAEPLREASEEFLRDLKIDDLTVFRDPDHRTRDALAAIGAFDNTYPTTIILDPQGRVLAVFRGYHLVHSKRYINNVLNQALQR